MIELFFIAIISVILTLMIVSAYRSSGGVLTASFLIMLYITFLFVGSINYYLQKQHYTFLILGLITLFYLIGIKLANRSCKFDPKNRTEIPLKLIIPLNSSVLKYSLILSLLIAIGLSIYRIQLFGITLIERSWYTGAIQDTTGILNRLLLSVSVMCLSITGLIFLSMNESSGKQSFRALSILSFGSYILFQILDGGKATAVMPFLLIGMTLFYSKRKTPRGYLLVMSISVLVLAVFLGSFWIKIFSLEEVFMLFFNRITDLSVLHFDFLIYGWAKSHSIQYGNTILMELHRFVAQVTPVAKQPLFNELIGNIRIGNPLSKVSGVSPELSIFGMGFANFGYPGAFLTALIFGYVVQRINIFALTCKSLNVFVYALLIYFIFILLGLARTGNVLIPIQDYLLKVSPAFVMLTFIYIIIALPFPNAFRWRRIRKIT